MSAKLVYSLSDGNSDLQKETGCMNGLFHLFDGHHFLSGRRIKGQSPKRLPPVQGDNNSIEPKNAYGSPTEDNSKVVKEKQRISYESSRTSFSSSSCSSSFSSLDYKALQLEHSLSSQGALPETPSRGRLMNQPNASPRLGQHSQDLPKIVKDSIHREGQTLSIKTAVNKEKTAVQNIKHVDSPRPMQLPQSFKPKVSGVNESLHLVPKVHKAQWNSTLVMDSTSSLTPRERHRYSCDGRELRDSSKSTIKLKELPRLSLDSKRGSVGDNTSMKSNYLLGDAQRGNGIHSRRPNSQQEQDSYMRPSNVVAKLMGLDDFPNSTSNNENQTRVTKTSSKEQVPTSRSLRRSDEKRQDQTPTNSMEPLSCKLQRADSEVKKNMISSASIEPAPWKQPSGIKTSPKPAFKCHEAPKRSSDFFPSVYGEIEKRLAELEFRKSGKDLRALKQILEAMQKTKDMLETRKGDHASDPSTQTGNYSSISQVAGGNQQSNSPTSARTKGSAPKNFKSPIVIMKSSKHLEKSSCTGSSRIMTEKPAGLRKIQTSKSVNEESVDKQKCKNLTPRKLYLKDPSGQPLYFMDKTTSPKAWTRTKVLQHDDGENTTSPAKTSGTVSPRRQQKKLDLERSSCLMSALPDSSKTRKQLNRQTIGSGSPCRDSTPKSPCKRQKSKQTSNIISRVRSLSDEGSVISQQSFSSINSREQIDAGVMSTNGQEKADQILIEQNDQEQENPAGTFNGERSKGPPVVGTLEQPSPVSVLEATFLEDQSPSPVKKILTTFKDDQALDSDEAEWNIINLDKYSDSPRLSTGISHNHAESIQHLVQNLGQTRYAHEKAIIPCDESQTNPDHRCILEVMLASGLLRDADSCVMPVQSHPKCHPISQGCTWSAYNEQSHEKANQSDPIGTIRRRLLFDTVNEILLRKLELEGSWKQWFSTNQTGPRKLRSQQLFRDICIELDQLQVPNSCRTDEEDSLTSIFCQDFINESESWTDCQSEIPGVVLDVERLIFKDLISETVNGETRALQQTGAARLCRQLFPN